MKLERRAGILLHLTSLGQGHGIGDMGLGAFEFIDFLKKSQITVWQILPLNPVDCYGSPYQSSSAFAGNSLLISLDELVGDGYLSPYELRKKPDFHDKAIDFKGIKEYKESLMRIAFFEFIRQGIPEEYYRFVSKQSYWLENYALFIALRKLFPNQAWNQWEKGLSLRKAATINRYKKVLQNEIEYQKFIQFIFFRQWNKVKKYANYHGIRILGDMPIFVSYDSSDVWSFPQYFALDEKGRPTKVAGVPPDYFSKTGQLWGNPLYDWEHMEQDNFLWMTNRVKHLLKQVDYIRIDHFRGFEACWEIPAGAKTAEEGQWVKAPGRNIFQNIHDCLGELPVIAEDLGFITPQVEELKQNFGFPGMKVLQFTLQEEIVAGSQEQNDVLYIGTHDNDTLVGWYNKEVLVGLTRNYKDSINNLCWELIETALQSNSQLVILPMQDVLGLDSEARMNYPGTVAGNWQWRLEKNALNDELAEKLAEVIEKYRRK